MKHKTLRTLLCVILTVCFCFSAIVPASAAGLFSGDTGAATGWDEWIRSLKDLFTDKGEIETEDTTATDTNAENTEFLRIFHLDCGRIYFSKDDILEIIDVLSANNYTHLELAFGNGGLRFLLDDMELSYEANGETKTHTSDAVKTAIQNGNTAFVGNDGHKNSSAANTCLTETEMDEIIAHAGNMGIKIIPLLNSPGHANAIVSAYNALNDTTVGGYSVNGNRANSTIDITNTSVVNFTKALIQKYVDYFAEKGCTYFNLGADEFANDPSDINAGYLTNGVTDLNNTMKGNFVNYVNAIAGIITGKNMTPMMFNDGYAWTEAGFDPNLVVCFWTDGGVNSATIAGEEHKIINTNKDWYYVLGSPFGEAGSDWCSYASATNGVTNTKVTTMKDGGSISSDKLAGAMICLWCDFTDETYTDTEKTNVTTLLQTLATNNTNEFGTIATEQRTISMAVGETKEVTIDEVDAQTLNTEKLNAAVATVTAGDTTVISYTTNEVSSLTAGTQYLIQNKRSQQLLTTATAKTNQDTNGLKTEGTASGDSEELWTLEYYSGNNNYSGYTLSRTIDGKTMYLAIGENTATLSEEKTALTFYRNTSQGTYEIYSTVNSTKYYLNDFGNKKGVAAGWADSTAANDEGSQWSLHTRTEISQSLGTKLTFTGVSVGTTQVCIGDICYTIYVTAPSLTYYPYISSFPVHVSGTTENNCKLDGDANPMEISPTLSGIQTEEGVALADITWAAGTWKYASASVQTVYWKGMLHGTTNKQNGNKNDMSMEGTEFKYVRYGTEGWQVSADRNEWTTIDMENNEVCAYYLQKTNITEEVSTYVKDWAYTTSEYNTYINSGEETSHQGHKALSFATVYPNGELKPTEDEIYSNSTIIYWADTGVIESNPTLFIRVGVNDVYEVEKITWTKGNIQEESATGGTLNWEKVDTDSGAKWYKETECWNVSSGTEPTVRTADFFGKDRDYTYNKAKDAVLILIYLKPVEKEDSLSVVYWDDNENSQIFQYPINVKNVSTEAVKTFLNSLNQKSDVSAGEFTLDDDAYITNVKNQNEPISKDITKLTHVQNKYRSGLYNYVKAEISADGKTLTLHYNLKNADYSATYVVDFGLPIVLNGADFNVDNLDSVTDMSLAKMTGKLENTGNYGTAKIDIEKKTITYTLSKPLDKAIEISFYVWFGKDDQKVFTAYIIPATNVYYEESFMTEEKFSLSGTDTKPTSDIWTADGTADTTTTQAAQTASKQNYPYGYDPAYAESTSNHSMGSAQKATLNITASQRDVYTENALTFTFKGNGYDIISDCGTDAGLLIAYTYLVDGDTETLKAIDVIDNYFCGDESYITGTGTLAYQVPVLRKLNMDYGTYKVKVIGYLRQTAGTMTADASTNSSLMTASLDSPVTYAYTDNNTVVNEILADLGITDLSGVEVNVSYVDDNSILNGGTGVFTNAASDSRSKLFSNSVNAVSNSTQTTWKSGSAVVSVDAFRVYNPLGNLIDANSIAYTAYALEQESGLTYGFMYDYLAKSGTAVTDSEAVENSLIYVEYDGDTGVAAIKDYKKQGPNNEIYITAEIDKTNSVGIILKDWAPGNSKLMVSAKSVLGSPAIYTKSENSQDVKVAGISSKTELYYDLSNYVKYDSTLNAYVLVISNQSKDKSILSISGIKITSTISAGESTYFAQRLQDYMNSTGESTYNPSPFNVTSVDNVCSGEETSLVVWIDGSVDSFKLYDKDNKEVKLTTSWMNKKAYNKKKTTNKSYTLYFTVPDVTTETTFQYKLVAVNTEKVESNPIEISVTVKP